MTSAATSRYRTVLLDLDHTLLDSDASEVAAFAVTMRSVGLDPNDELFDCYSGINRALWQAVERGETTPGELRLTRFEQFIAAVGLVGSADAESMATTFTDGLGNNGELYPGAKELLRSLAENHVLAMVTNGLSEVQRTRIKRLALEPYFSAIVISGEVGASKPGTEIFDIVFDHLVAAKRSSTLMVGDSLTSDIQGGVNYGIDTCWYNPSRKPTPTVGTDKPIPTFEIQTVGQLNAIAAGG